LYLVMRRCAGITSELSATVFIIAEIASSIRC
jgi:hypothetical protein